MVKDKETIKEKVIRENLECGVFINMDNELWCSYCGMECSIDEQRNCIVCGKYLGEENA